MYIYHFGLPSTVGSLTTSGSANTELGNMAFRQATRGFDINAIQAGGRGTGLTVITGISIRARRWTTASTGGTTLTAGPRRQDQPAAATTGVSSSGSAITAGTGDGSTQVAFSFGAAGPGGWVARDDDSKIHVQGGSADSIDLNSISGGTSLALELAAEIGE